jgi:hypothetical protein
MKLKKNIILKCSQKIKLGSKARLLEQNNLQK